MKKFYIFIMAIAFFVGANAATNNNIETGKPAPDFTTIDINGKPQSISQYKGKIIVLEWNNPECPFVKKFYDSLTMQNLQLNATKDNVIWLTINSSAPGKQGNMTAAQAKEYVLASKAKPTAYINDPEGKIGKLYAAASTPTIVVVDKNGNLAYHGAIDNKPSFKAEDIATAKNYAVAAIAELKAGKPVAIPSTKSYGCAVKYAE